MKLPIRRMFHPEHDIPDVTDMPVQQYANPFRDMEFQYVAPQGSVFSECRPVSVSDDIKKSQYQAYFLFDSLLFSLTSCNHNYSTLSKYTAKRHLVELRVAPSFKVHVSIHGTEEYVWPAGHYIHMDYHPAGYSRKMYGELSPGAFIYFYFEPEFIVNEMGLSTDNLPPALESIFLDLKTPVSDSFAMGVDSLQATDRLVAMLENGKPGAFYIFNGILDYFQLILADIKRHSTESDELPVRLTEQELEKIQCVKELIDADITRKLTASELSAETGLNRNKLRYGFRQKFGVSIADYSTRLRMEKARELLWQSGAQVSDVAFQLGYSEQASFTRVFKGYFGCTPKQMRESGPTSPIGVSPFYLR